MFMQEHWISVKTKLPEAPGDYLVTDGFGIMVTNFNSKVNMFNVLDEEENLLLIDFWEPEQITHWMDLPNLPK
jgi:hypothetical protein